MTTMHGKICMVTGATSGIGKITALELAKMGANVIIVGRSREKGETVLHEIKARSGSDQVDLIIADLSVQASIRRLVEVFKRRYSQLHVLVNNAGAVFFSRTFTEDGIERTFALNHLNYFLLTALLLDILKASAPARIVNVSSDAQTMGKIDFDNLQGEKRFSGWGAYASSKLANVLFTYELARRLEGTGVTANVLHPGFVRTSFGHNNGLLMRGGMSLIQRFFAMTVAEGAQTSIYLASSPEVEGITGRYFVKSKAVSSAKQSYDTEAARRLWEVSEQLTRVTATAEV